MSAGADPYLPGHGDLRYSVRRYDLELEYRIHTNHLAGRAAVEVVVDEPLAEFGLDLSGLQVTKVTVGGSPAHFIHRGSRLTVRPSRRLDTGRATTIHVDYRGNPRPLPGPWGEAGWEELRDGVIVAGQPHGAPSWFPCNDRPSDKASYSITVTAASDYHVAANGRLVSRRRRASTTTWVYQQDEPMPPYLATLQIGRYQLRELTSAVPMQVLLPPRKLGRLEAGFGRQPAMMTAFVDMFGPYPYAAYRVVVTDEDLEMPLEATGMAVFGANFLTNNWEAERLVAHELAHQWFGNSVTLRTWNDIWLHEGFACYAEWLWSEHSGRADAAEHARRHWKRLDGLPQDLVLTDPGPDYLFDDRVYKRGALTLHSLRMTIGDAEYRCLLREWTRRYAHATATTADFRLLAAEVTGRDLTGLFDAWLCAPRLPPLPEPPR